MFPIVTLEKICEVIAGQSPPSSTYNFDGRGLPFFQGKADFGTLFPKTRVWCDEPKKIAQPNDILISVRAPVGPTNLCSTEACIGRGLSAIRAKIGTDFKYILYYLRAIEPELSTQGRGSTFSAITQSEIRNLQVPLPSLLIQKQIAAILEKADAAREKRRQANKLTEQFLQSAFLEMFGDPVANPMAWDIANVNDVASNIQYGYTEPATIENVGPKFLRITDIQNGMVDWDNVPYCKCPDLDKYKLESGDIVFARTGATTGKSFLIKHCPTAVFASYLIRVQLKKDVSPSYIYHFFQTESYWSQIRMGMTGSTQGGFNSSKLAEVKLPLPSIQVQEKFVALVEKVEPLRAKQRESEKELENLFGSLMQRAFKGELVR